MHLEGLSRRPGAGVTPVWRDAPIRPRHRGGAGCAHHRSRSRLPPAHLRGLEVRRGARSADATRPDNGQVPVRIFNPAHPGLRHDRRGSRCAGFIVDCMAGVREGGFGSQPRRPAGAVAGGLAGGGWSTIREHRTAWRNAGADLSRIARQTDLRDQRGILEQMNIAVVGTGYVGLVSGTCYAENGNDVACVDIESRRIAALSEGKIPIYEPGLGELVRRNLDEGRIYFSLDVRGGIGQSIVTFIAVG